MIMVHPVKIFQLYGPILLFDGWLLDDRCLQFGIKMPINAGCDKTVMQATILQELIRKKNQTVFAGKRDFRADLFNKSSSN